MLIHTGYLGRNNGPAPFNDIDFCEVKYFVHGSKDENRCQATVNDTTQVLILQDVMHHSHDDACISSSVKELTAHRLVHALAWSREIQGYVDSFLSSFVGNATYIAVHYRWLPRGDQRQSLGDQWGAEHFNINTPAHLRAMLTQFSQ